MERTLQRRINRIFANAPEVDAIVLSNTHSKDPNFVYLTRFTSGIFENNLLIVKRDRAKLITNPLEYETALEQKHKGLEIVSTTMRAETIEAMRGEVSGKIVGINENAAVARVYNTLSTEVEASGVVFVGDALTDARQIKDAGEIAMIKKATAITKRTMEEIPKEFRIGITEKELARKFNELSASLGADEPSFTTLVCFGPNAAMPHHFPDDTKLKYGDLILIDAGAKLKNYCSDISRTFIFGSNPSRVPDYDKKVEMIRIVEEAKRLSTEAIKAGAISSDIHNIAENHINTAAGGRYNGTLIHSLGHALGIEVHDGPGLSSLQYHALKPNMIVTVEPGIYVTGFGGVRIEDDVRVLKDGAVVL